MGITVLQAERLEPVTLEHVRDHAFEKRAQRGCGVCGQAKTHPDHHGWPPSLNVLGDGNRFAYRAMKEAWEGLFVALLTEAGLDSCGRIVAEGEITFPDRKRRDQGNHRFLLEKALGDALVIGGWLEDDDWAHYEFGGLAQRYEKGVCRTRLMLFPGLF
jgi:hypothetical protein